MRRLWWIWPCLISMGAQAAEPKGQPQAPNDAEFWELYDELADETGHIPAPEEVPPPKDQLTPSALSDSQAAQEDL